MANTFGGDSSCKALWRFESGELTADSIGTNTLTDYNTVGANTTNFREGSASADFEKDASERLAISDASLDSGFPGKSGGSNGSFTCCFWMMFESITLNRGIFAKFSNTAGQRGYQALIGASNNLIFQKGVAGDASSFEAYSHGSALTTGRWYHCGISYDDSTKTLKIRIWDDTAGAIHGSDIDTTTTTSIWIGDASLTLGQAATGYHDGELDEFVVFNRALSFSEIDSIRSGEFGSGTSNTQVTTSPGTLGLSGSAPSSAFSGAVTSAPGVGALTITPQAAEILFSGAVASQSQPGLLSLVPQAPQTTLSGAITSALEPGLLDLTGHPAQSAFSGAITSATLPGSLAFSGLAGQIIVSGAATVTVLTAAGALGLTGAAPSAAYSGTVRAQTLPGLLALAGVAPGLLHSGAVTVELLAGELSIDGQAVETTIGGGIRVETAAGLLSLLGNAPSVVISGGVRVETQPGAMALTGAAPVMIHAGLIEIVTAAGGLSIAGLPVTVSAGERLGPIFAPGLHSITVQRAVLSVTPVRGLRRFDGH